MPTDRILRATLANYSTFFLIAAMVTVPLLLAHAFVWRDVIATTEIHGAIESLPEGEAVRGVTAARIDQAAVAYGVVLVLVGAAVPLMVRATRRAIEADESGHAPTALGSWRGAFGGGGQKQVGPAPGPLAVALVVAAATWWLSVRIGLLLAEPLSDPIAFLGVGLARGVALALGLPFVLVGAALGRRTRPAPVARD